MVSGQLRVEGLSQRVEIDRDARGIPHVLADSEADAWFGLGFAHAQDRFAQMLWLRRIALGRSAEWIGSAGLESDRLARSLGFGRLAEQQVAQLDEEVRDALAAYAAGVNARMARIRAGRVAAPVELGLPRQSAAGLDPDASRGLASIEAWRESDSLAVGKLVAWGAGASHERAVVLSDLIERLGSMGARPFFPGGENELALAVRMDRPARPTVAEPPPALTRSLVEVASFRGSAWALPGRFTESGAPILVAEMTVAVTVPSLLYEAHVRGGRLDVAGVTVPGLPVFWAGRNPDVAWAAAPLPVAAVDLFKETLRRSDAKPADRSAATPLEPRPPPRLYQNGSRWVPVVDRTESIRIAADGDGGPRVERLVVAETRHGPLVSELLSRAPAREPLSLAWTGARKGDALTGLLRVARAGSVADVDAALSLHHDPPIEVVYADRAGAVGVRVAGWLPRRSLPSGLVPVPGQLRGFDWRVGIEPDALPHVAIPTDALGGGTVGALLAGRGPWMVSSGAPLADELAAVSIERLWQGSERSRRVRTLVAELALAGPVELRAAADIQDDVAANVDPDLIEALLALAAEEPELSPEAAEVAELLRRWDGMAAVDSRGAAAFELLIGHLIRELLSEPLGPELLARYLALPGVRPSAVVQGIVVSAARGGRQGGWTDPEEVSDAVRESLRRTWMSLSYRLGHTRERWTWGRLHSVVFHPFGHLERGALLAEGSLGPYALGGQSTSVARAEYDRETFSTRVASSYRMAVDLASPNRMLTSLAPGQSEHPGHPHFDDGAAAWRDGRPSLLVTSSFLQDEAAVERLTLEPSR
jgi:penicillin amidase